MAELARKRAEEQREAARQAARPVPSGPPVRLSGDRYVFAQPLMFSMNKPSLRPDSDPVVAELARLVKANGHSIRIGVHSDSQGNSEYNKTLTQRRADEVKRRLVALGVAGSQVEAVGYGEHLPIADNSTPAGRAKNRRVEVEVR